jgi:hypothetical protein
MLVDIHVGSVILLFCLALLAIFFAVWKAAKAGVDRTNEWLVQIALAIWLAENVVALIVILTGLAALYVGSMSLSLVWAWMSLLIMVFYSVTLLFMLKPARPALAEGGNPIKVAMQVLLHFVYLLLIAFAFALMLLKPFQGGAI